MKNFLVDESVLAVIILKLQVFFIKMSRNKNSFSFFFFLKSNFFFNFNDITVDYFVRHLECEQCNTYKFAKIASSQNILA